MSSKNLQANMEFGFLYKKCSSPQMALSYWLQIPEFIEELRNLEKNNIPIDDRSVFSIMQKIYFTKKQESDTSFKYYLARKSLRKISETLFGNADNWDKVYSIIEIS